MQNKPWLNTCGKQHGPDEQVEQVEPEYVVRFIRPEDSAHLVDLYHMAKGMLPGDKAHVASERMKWACTDFVRTHPYVTELAAYKDLCGLLGR